MGKVFSGMQPTGGGIPHLGNYLGAIRSYVELQADHACTYCVVDQHATTVPYDPTTLASDSIATAACLIACGIDVSRSTLFRQSSVRAHSLLGHILGHVASVGPLERMSQFGSKRDRQPETEVPLGLLTYPVLMAADILLHRAELVPVGEDQSQHLRFTGMLARKFNSRFATTLFGEPRAIMRNDSGRIMSLRDPGRKMSKSDSDRMATIGLADDIDTVAAKYRSAVTDVGDVPGNAEELRTRPAVRSLVRLLASLEDISEQDVCDRFGGRGYARLKNALVEAHERIVSPVGKHASEMMLDGRARVLAALEEGRIKAEIVAEATLAEAYRLVGYA